MCLLNAFLVCGLFGGGYFVYKKARSGIQEVGEAFNEYFSADPSTGISPFGQLVEQIAEVQAARLGTTIQAGIRGSLGGQMKGIVPALEAEAVQAYPELGIAEVLPKSLKKSPVAQVGLQLLIEKLMKGGAGSGRNGRGSAPAGGQAKFNL